MTIIINVPFEEAEKIIQIFFELAKIFLHRTIIFAQGADQRRQNAKNPGDKDSCTIS
jgi:hypothetical protein